MERNIVFVLEGRKYRRYDRVSRDIGQTPDANYYPCSLRDSRSRCVLIRSAAMRWSTAIVFLSNEIGKR